MTKRSWVQSVVETAFGPQKCKVRLSTIDSYGPVIPRIPYIVRSLVHRFLPFYIVVEHFHGWLRSCTSLYFVAIIVPIHLNIKSLELPHWIYLIIIYPYVSLRVSLFFVLIINDDKTRIHNLYLLWYHVKVYEFAI